MTGDYPQYLTTGEVARLLGVGSMTVIRWAKAGLLTPGRTPGGHRRFPAGEVYELLARKGLPVPTQGGGR